MGEEVSEVTRAHDIACAVSDVIWGGELGWTNGDYKALIAAMRRLVRKGLQQEAEESDDDG